MLCVTGAAQAVHERATHYLGLQLCQAQLRKIAMRQRLLDEADQVWQRILCCVQIVSCTMILQPCCECNSARRSRASLMCAFGCMQCIVC